MSPRRRRLNRRFYALLFRLYRLLFPAAAPPGPAAPARVRRVLVGRTDRVGDLVVSLPALDYLRAVLPPGAEVDVVTPVGSLLEGDPRVARVFAPGRGAAGWWRMVRALRARRYDVVLSVRLRNHLAEGLTAALVAPRGAVRATVRRPREFLGLFTHAARLPRGVRHVRPRLLALAARAVGHGPPPATAAALGALLARHPGRLAPNPAADARIRGLAAARWGGRAYAAVNAWATDPRRALGPALAAEVAAGLAARGLAAVLTPPPGAEDGAEAVARAARERLTAGLTTGLPAGRAGPVAVAPPSSDLRDLAALLRGAAVVVTGDTANVHLAGAAGVPLVAVYTDLAVEADVWGAWGAPRRVVHVRDARPAGEVPAGLVLAAVDEVLRDASSVTGGAPGGA